MWLVTSKAQMQNLLLSLSLNSYMTVLLSQAIPARSCVSSKLVYQLVYQLVAMTIQNACQLCWPGGGRDRGGEFS